MFNPFQLLISGGIITATLYALKFDLNFWVCVAIYATLNGLWAVFTAAMLMQPGIGIFFYVILSMVVYFGIGIVVTYFLNNSKDMEEKMTIGIGVVIQFFTMMFVNSIFGAIFNLSI